MNDVPQTPPLYPPDATPKRHGCLTAWLIFIIVVCALSAVATPFSLNAMRQAGVQVSTLGMGVLVLCNIANIVFAVALLKWLRWGFYGFVAVSLIVFVLNLSMGLGIGQSILGLVGVGILYGVLNIGGPNKAWPRLR